MIGLYLIFGLFALASWLVSKSLQNRFKRYSQIPTANGLSGKAVAEKMLRDSGIQGVKIGSVSGMLTDHYNPVNKTVNLSHDVYFGTSIAAAAIAAHECGHAVQHARGYAMLNFRSQLVPVVNFASQWMQWVLLAGILMVNIFPQLLFFGILLFATTTLFSIITLPVEVDASRRALVWLKTSGITTVATQEKAFDALKWAAYTYFIAAISSLATLIYLVLVYMGGRRS
ncbi:MAG TPA: zinc metallopeptidase [Williamwhitmania sp.]|nr:zinc metallopeptidase [Williamwhitmania sp.]HUX54167.1 zinc metallopeptidase [Williamwhitmania sp.]